MRWQHPQDVRVGVDTINPVQVIAKGVNPPMPKDRLGDRDAAGAPGLRCLSVLSTARSQMCRTLPANSILRWTKKRGRLGSENTHWRTGTCGKTWSTK